MWALGLLTGCVVGMSALPSGLPALAERPNVSRMAGKQASGVWATDAGIWPPERARSPPAAAPDVRLTGRACSSVGCLSRRNSSIPKGQLLGRDEDA